MNETNLTTEAWLKEELAFINGEMAATLNGRLKAELAALEKCLVSGGDLCAGEETAKHAEWARELMRRYDFTAENAAGILRHEVGQVFKTVLEHAGVFKRDERGRAAFRRFISRL